MNNREIMIENYINPFHRGLKEDNNYKKIKVINTNCADELDIMFLVKDNKLEDILFDGEACAIAISSTSILFKKLIGKNIDDVIEIINEFEKMLNNEKCDKKVLGDLIVFEEIYKTPNRVTCAFLSAKGIKENIVD